MIKEILGAILLLFVVALVLFPEFRRGLKVLASGILGVFVKDLAKTPEGAEAVYNEAIEEERELYRKACDVLNKASGEYQAAQKNLTKLQEAKSRQAMLIARSQMADTQKNLAKSTGGFDGNSAMEKFNRMEEKIRVKEAEAAAFTEIADAGEDDDLNDAFEQIESAAKVDAELARLMAEMNGEPSAEPAVEAPAVEAPAAE